MIIYLEENRNSPDADLIEMVERVVDDQNPNVNFDNIVEFQSAKRALTEAIILPLLMPDFFLAKKNLEKDVIIRNPVIGKTFLAKIFPTQGKTIFFNVSLTTFASKKKGENEKLVRILFEMVRFYDPSTIFIDEVDFVGTKRTDGENEVNKKVLAELLVQIEGISEANVEKTKEGNKEVKQKFLTIMGATKLHQDLDEKLRKIFEKRIYISL